MPQYPIVALLGRPNVGKSTLFNRIVGRRLAVVYDKPGTTRDRQFSPAEWSGVGFMLVDTGGIEDLETVKSGLSDPLAEDSADFIQEIRAQADLALREADVIIMVVDQTTGITAADEEIADILRKHSKPVFIAANKADSHQQRQQTGEFYGLGIGEVFGISSLHGAGVGDLLDSVIRALPKRIEEQAPQEDIPRIAIMGKPNAGKSSLLNKLLGEERVIVSPVAGTTRDPIDTRIQYHGEEIILVDTAGIRKRGKIETGVEKYSVLRAFKALGRADVALIVLDATEGITAQDTHVAGYVLEENVSAVVLVNKWDAIEKDNQTMVEWRTLISEKLNFMEYVPVLFISALTGQRIHQVLETALAVREARFMRLATSEVNRIVRDAMIRQMPPSKSGKRLNIKYASQVAVNPPKFLFHVNDPELAHFSYQRFLENEIRAVYPFPGTPIIMEFRKSERREKG